MKMYIRWITILCLKIVAAFVYYADDSAGGICGDHDRAQRYVHQITSTCYHITMPATYNWRMCDREEEDFTCRHLENYITIIPSCSHCERLTGMQQVQCRQRQLKGAECAIKAMLIPVIEKVFSCERYKGGCVLKRNENLPTDHDEITPTTVNPTPSTTTMIFEQGVTDQLRRKCEKCKVCEECKPCEQSRGMSVGGAVGLLFLGIVIGTVVTCTTCLFVPALHSKSSSILHGKVLKKRRSPTNESNTTSTAARQVVGISNIQYSDSRGVTPDTGGTYNDLSRQSGSHTYTGLQSPTSDTAIYCDPTSDTYDAPHDRITRSSSVNSPTYRIPQDGVISGITNGNTGHSLSNFDTNNHNGLDENSPIPTETDHQYFVLHPENSNRSALPEPHQSPARDSTYTPEHSYFVLEKQ